MPVDMGDEALPELELPKSQQSKAAAQGLRTGFLNNLPSGMMEAHVLGELHV